MIISKKKNIEIISDIINLLNQGRKDFNDIHIDLLRDEIIEYPDNFHYTINEFNYLISEIF